MCTAITSDLSAPGFFVYRLSVIDRSRAAVPIDQVSTEKKRRALKVKISSVIYYKKIMLWIKFI